MKKAYLTPELALERYQQENMATTSDNEYPADNEGTLPF